MQASGQVVGGLVGWYAMIMSRLKSLYPQKDGWMTGWELILSPGFLVRARDAIPVADDSLQSVGLNSRQRKEYDGQQQH